jgi:hypothetical protein
MKKEKDTGLGNIYNLGVVLLVSIGFILGCSALGGVGKAEEAVEVFHSQMNDEKFDVIYENSALQLKTSTDKGNFIRILSGLKKKMGNINESKRNKYEAVTENGISLVNLEYETDFSNGKVKEEFQFQIEDNKPTLNYYKYNVTK